MTGRWDLPSPPGQPSMISAHGTVRAFIILSPSISSSLCSSSFSSSSFPSLSFSLPKPPLPTASVCEVYKGVEMENVSSPLWKPSIVSASYHSCIRSSLSTMLRTGRTHVRKADVAPPTQHTAGTGQAQCWWTGQVPSSQLGSRSVASLCCLCPSFLRESAVTRDNDFGLGVPGLRLTGTERC